MPLVDATAATLEGYGHWVDDPADCPIEIVRWPALGRRPVDVGTGDQGGTTEGVFISTWRGDILYGSNDAVDGRYVLAYAAAPPPPRVGAIRSFPGTPAHAAVARQLPPGWRPALLPA
jgi:hypothetical protein